MPAVAYWPGRIKPDTVTNEPVLGMDLFATMVSLAGARMPRGLSLDGVDLAPLLLEGKGLPGRMLFWRFRKQKAVRKGPWKLLVIEDGVKLFNLAEDLGEENDLAGDKPQIVAELKAELAAWEREISRR